MELTHSEYCNMLLTLDMRNTQAGTTICAMYGCSFVSGCDMNMLQMSSFYTTVCECEDVFTHNTHLSASVFGLVLLATLLWGQQVECSYIFTF